MDDQQSFSKNENSLQKLKLQNKIYEKMNQLIAIDQPLFRQYITLYIQNHTLNQDYFISFCQHEIISNLFGTKGRLLSTISILQMFNLLLVNTNQINNLVYILSQKQLHQFMFNKFNIYKQSGQSIEYYIQLLKTIILKISSQKNNSLIKMFCNNKYPSFPLLTAVVTLASAWNLQGLVRVTAQQCVLQLINLINQKQIGRGYLTDLQIVIFFYQISSHLNNQDMDSQGSLKYIIDIIFALKNTKISLQLLMNSIINNFIIPNIASIDKILSFINYFIDLIQEQQNFPQNLYLHIKTNLFNIIKIIYFSRFLNSTYYAALKIIPNLKSIQTPNLMIQYTKRGQKISAYLLQYDNIIQSQLSQRQKIMLFESWVNFNSNSDQMQKIKNQNNGRSKRSSSLFGYLFKKSDNVQQYIKNSLISGGLSYQTLTFPLYKLTATINFKTSIYLVEQIITQTLQHDKNNMNGDIWNRQDYDIHLNDHKGKFQLNIHLYKEIINIIYKLQKNKVPLQFGFKHTSNFEDIKFNQNYLPQYLFLSKFRQYLANVIVQNLITTDSTQTIQQIVFLQEITKKLQLHQLLDKKSKQKILYKLQLIHQDINDITFSHSDFKGLINYVQMKKSERYKSIINMGKQKILNIENQSKIEQKTFYFQFLSQLIDQNSSSIYDFVVFQWSHVKSRNQTIFLQAKVKDKHQNLINISFDIEKGFLLTYKLRQMNQITNKIIQLKQSDPKLKMNNNSFNIIFEDYSSGFEMENKLEAEVFISQIQRIRSCRQQIITKLIVHYFDMIYNSLKENIFHK